MGNTLTVKDICIRFGVGEHTVLHWLKSGQLRGLNVGRDPGKKKCRWRVTQQDLESFILTRTATPPPPILATWTDKSSSKIVREIAYSSPMRSWAEMSRIVNRSDVLLST